MRKIIPALTALLAVAAPAAVAAGVIAPGASPAHAAGVQAREGDTRPCVTRGEARQLRQGMTRTRVQAIFDSKGIRYAYDTDPRWENRGWHKCWSHRAYLGLQLMPWAGAWRVNCESRRCWF